MIRKGDRACWVEKTAMQPSRENCFHFEGNLKGTGWVCLRGNGPVLKSETWATHHGRGRLVGADTLHCLGGRGQDDLDVQHQRPFADVLQVEANHFFEWQLAATIYLP